MLQRDTGAFLYILQLCELQLHSVHFFEDCHLPLLHLIACESSHPEENKNSKYLHLQNFHRWENHGINFGQLMANLSTSSILKHESYPFSGKKCTNEKTI